jgi:hypothetical protein
MRMFGSLFCYDAALFERATLLQLVIDQWSQPGFMLHLLSLPVRRLGDYSQRLPPDHLQQGLGIARTLHFDSWRGLVNFSKVLNVQANVLGAEVLLEPLAFRGPRNRHNPRLLREQPGEGDLRGRCVLARSERLKPSSTTTDQIHVGVP